MYMYIYVYTYAYAHMCIYISTTRACASVQRCSSFLAMEAIAKLSWVLREHRAGCRFRPPSCPFVEPAAFLLADVFAKKFIQNHASSWSRGRRYSVAQASFDHPCWCGPHPVCLWFTLAHGRGSHPQQKSFFAAIFALFFASFGGTGTDDTEGFAIGGGGAVLLADSLFFARSLSRARVVSLSHSLAHVRGSLKLDLWLTHSPSLFFGCATFSNVFYGVATISRLLKTIGLFCKRAL